jgi:hypothetical protein
MRTAHELLTTELRPWSDDTAACFIRNVILPRSHHYKPGRIAADAAPKPPAAPSLATIGDDSSSWAYSVNSAAMNDVSRRIQSCFGGKTHSEGKRQFDENERHEGSAHA